MTERQRIRRRPPARGVALVVVLAALALVAFVAGRFAQRIDELSRQTHSFRAHAEQALQARNALAAGLYFVATRQIGPAGFGPANAPELHADNRAYRLPGGGELRLQDQRGLYPLNTPQRESLGALLRSLGVAQRDTDSFVDVLEDYLDTDNFKRLSGAEAPDYAALGLPPPRNDWLVAVRELNRMPHWRDAPQVVSALESWASAERQGVLNPNTAPIALLAAMWPQARPEQLELLRSLRATVPFVDGAAAQRATGLMLDRDGFVFHLGPQLRMTVSGAGSARALQYNVALQPAGRDAPWLISDMQAMPRIESPENPERAEPFPLAFTESLKP